MSTEIRLSIKSSEEIFEGFEWDKHKHFVFNRVMEVLKNYDGKILTKRILTDLSKQLPEWTFKIGSNWTNRVELHVYENSKNILDATLLYKTEGKADVFDWSECYNNISTCYGRSAKERIERYSDSEKVSQMISKNLELLEMADKIRLLNKEVSDLKDFFYLGDH